MFRKKDVLRNFAKFTGNTCARASFLIKLQTWPATLLKKRLWHRCFPVDFAKFLRTSFLQNTSGGCFRINTLWQKVSEQHNVKFKISVYLREEEACNNKLNVLAQCSSKDRLGLLCK